VRLIEDLARPEADLAQHADEYRQRVLAAIEQKRAGGTIEATEPPASPPTADLEATLRKSLEVRRPLAKAEPRTAEGEKKPAAARRRRAS